MRNSPIVLTLTTYFLAAILSGASRAQTEPSSIQGQPRNAMVRVVTISQDGLQGRAGKKVIDATLTRLERAASFRPDIACLPESFTNGEPETVPGPTTKRLSRWAKEHKCYVICPILIRDSGRTYNAAIVIDRQGHIIGRYCKIRPTEGELNRGICPGPKDPPVLETDFGTIGIQICFDVNWHGQWQRLSEKGAKIVFFASAYPATRQIRTLAWLNQYFVVASTKSRPASIYDVTGETLATTGKFQQWAGALLPLGKTVFEIDFHVSKMREIQKKYGSRVEVTWYHDEDLVTLASLDPVLSVQDLIREYELTPHRDYILRAQRQQDKSRPEAKP
ncbi:MAG: carbon-nitrogen hydrolase family protein [Planctomycetota bacterium]